MRELRLRTRDDVNTRGYGHDGGSDGAVDTAEALALLTLTLLVLGIPALTIQE